MRNHRTTTVKGMKGHILIAFVSLCFFCLFGFEREWSTTELRTLTTMSMVDGAYCGSYSSSAEKNRLAFPLNDGYSHERGDNFFGAPVVCDSFAPKVYYVPDDGGKNGTTKEEVEQQAFGVALGLGVLPTECRIAATRFLCASAFRRCEMFPISESLPNFLVLPLPRPPCRSLCEEVASVCKTAGLPSILPECDSTDEQGNSLFPKKSLTFHIDSVGEFKVPCEDSSSFEDFYEQYKEKRNEEKEKKEGKKAEEEAEKNLSALDPVVCPWPLEPNTKHNVEDPPCQLVCPQGNVYSKTEWGVVMNIKLWGASSSVILDFWTFLTCLTIVEKRKFPAVLAIVASLVHMLWMIIFVISASIGEEVFCIDKFKKSTTFNHPMCGVEGAAVALLTLWLAMIWLILSLQLFFYIVLDKRNSDLKKFTIPTFILIGLYPSVLVLIEYPLGVFGYGTAGTFCFFNSRQWQWSAYWWPVGVALIIVLVTSISSLVAMIKIKRKFMTLKGILAKHMNIIMFVLAFSWVYGFFFINKIYLEIKSDSWYDDLEDTVICNAESGGLNDCRVADDERYRYSTLVFNTLLICCSGVFIFLAWGCSFKYILHWKRFFQFLFKGEFKELGNLKLETLTRSTLGGSSSGGTYQGGKSNPSTSNGTATTSGSSHSSS